jgi:hypothetical protein
MSFLAVFGAAAAEPAAPPAYGLGADVSTVSSAMALDGDVLYMTWPSAASRTNRWLTAVDVSKPEAPRLLARLALDGFPQDLAKVGPHVFVVNGLDLRVVEAVKPEELKLAARLAIAVNPLEGPQGLDVKGGFAFLACRRAGIKTVDISRPLEPKVVQSCPLPGFARDVTVAGDYLVAAMDNQGLQILALGQKGELKPVGRLSAPEGSVARVLVSGGTAFLAAGQTLVACVSLADPSRSAWLGATSGRGLLTPYYGCYAHDLALLGAADPAAAADRRLIGVADGESGLIVADVTDPTAPAFVAGFLDDSRGILTSLAVRGRTVFVNDETFGLRVADVSNPARPVWLGAGLKIGP